MQGKNKGELIAKVEEFCHQCKSESEGIAHKLLGKHFKGTLYVYNFIRWPFTTR